MSGERRMSESPDLRIPTKRARRDENPLPASLLGPENLLPLPASLLGPENPLPLPAPLIGPENPLPAPFLRPEKVPKGKDVKIKIELPPPAIPLEECRVDLTEQYKKYNGPLFSAGTNDLIYILFTRN